MATGIKVEGFDKIDANLEKVLTGAKAKREQLHEKVATELKTMVDQSIAKHLTAGTRLTVASLMPVLSSIT